MLLDGLDLTGSRDPIVLAISANSTEQMHRVNRRVRVRSSARSLGAVWVMGTALLTACGDDDSPAATESGSTAASSSTTQSMDSAAETGSSGEASGGSTTTADESSDTGPEVCPASHLCVATPPPQWNGPVALVETDTADEPGACAGEYGTEAAEMFDDLVAPAASCICACGDSVNAICRNNTRLQPHEDDASCESNTLAQQVYAGICNILEDPLHAADSNWIMEPIPVVSGTCPPSTIEAIEPATFSRRVLACGGATLGGGCASGDVCVPPAVEGGVCVWQEGEHECPADFNERRVLYTGLTDTRSCQTCTCGTATGLCDGARIYFYSTDTCTPGTTDTSIGPTFGCQQNQSPTSAVRLTLGQPTAFCQPSTPSSVGDAAAEGPVTVCCTQ